jgi:hypothetical protein
MTSNINTYMDSEQLATDPDPNAIGSADPNAQPVAAELAATDLAATESAAELATADTTTEQTTAEQIATELMRRIDDTLSHIWMVRTFLKHSDEASEDEELAEVHRELYDFMLALGPSIDAGDAKKYLHLARKKFSKLKRTAEHFAELQPEVSGHMNFKMAAKSLGIAVSQIEHLLK